MAIKGYEMHDARERLGAVLGGAEAEKYTNPQYNETIYLDKYIEENLPGAKVDSDRDIVIADGWEFDLDRTVPRIGKPEKTDEPEDLEPVEKKAIYASLKGDTLFFSNNAEKAGNGDKVYGEIKEEYIKKGTWANRETDTEWFHDNANIHKIEFDSTDGKIVPEHMSYWFFELNQLTEIKGLENLDTRYVKDMDFTFYKCESLSSLDLSKFITSNVTSMDSTFYGCIGLRQLNLSSFDTRNVTNMNGMFQKCTNLSKIEGLKGTKFNTSNVTSMNYMFQDCTNLQNLDLTDFNTEKVESMIEMFTNCQNLTELNLSNFKTSNVVNMKNIFKNCTKLTKLELSKDFETGKVTQMDSMFQNCSSLKELDLSSFDTSNVKNMTSMFQNCHALTKLDLSSFNTSNVKDMIVANKWEYAMVNMFQNCHALTSLTLSKNFTTKGITMMTGMFQKCSSLKEFYLSSFDTSNVVNFTQMFKECTALTYLNCENFVVKSNANVGDMFNNCANLETLNISKMNLTGHQEIVGGKNYIEFMFNKLSTKATIITNAAMKEWINERYNTLTKFEIVDK